MRCLGILSVREDTGKKNGKRIRILEKERFCREIRVIVAEFSVSREELQKKKQQRKRQLFRKGERFLRRLGADGIVPTLSCSRAFEIPVTGNMVVELPVSPRDMPEALKTVLKEYRESPKGKTGWVLDQTCSPVCLPIFMAMSQKVQYLSLVTADRKGGEAVEENLCREYGVSPEIHRTYPWKERENTLLADVDGGRILVDGRTVLSGKRMTLDLQGYQVDLPKLIEEYPELWKLLSFLEWCIRKSG